MESPDEVEAVGTPQVSVVMAVYNGCDYLRLAIESVLAQTFDAFEFIIIDDCSTDDTPEVVRSFGDTRVVYSRNLENLGQTKSLNAGLELSQGEFIARIDADDTWYPNKLEQQLRYMVSHPDVAICGTWADRIDAGGNITGSYLPPTDSLDIRFRILRASPVCHVSLLMRGDSVRASGGYDPRYRYAADHDLFSRMLLDGHAIVNLSLKLTQFREMPQTFGTANKVGPAGDESAEIIGSNALRFVGLDLSPKQSRDIALLFFPAAELPPERLAEACENLRFMARVTYDSLPLRVRVELLAVLFWSLFKRFTLMKSEAGRGGTGRELHAILRAFRRSPFALIVAVASAGLAVAGAGVGMGVKAHLMTCFGWLRTATSRR